VNHAVNSFSKLIVLAYVAAGTAFFAPTASQAQIQRQAMPVSIDPRQPAPVCYTPARRPVVTDGSWTVQPASGPAHAAVPLTVHPYYHTTLPGSQWIGNAVNDGKYPGEAGTTFTYTYHFCLCGLPPGTKGPVQATMSLEVYSDNEFKALLNGNPIGSSVSLGIFNGTPTNIPSVPASFFQAGDNTLTIVVMNEPNSPTGLDVSGYIAGYFQALPCPRG
jgi:hypothetical protein